MSSAFVLPEPWQNALKTYPELLKVAPDVLSASDYVNQWVMVRIIWRDLANWSDLAETMADLSAMADVCIQQTLSLLYDWQVEINGIPRDDDGREQKMIVLGMGKLGAGELNLSSDNDLIFT